MPSARRRCRPHHPSAARARTTGARVCRPAACHTHQSGVFYPLSARCTRTGGSVCNTQRCFTRDPLAHRTEIAIFIRYRGASGVIHASTSARTSAPHHRHRDLPVIRSHATITTTATTVSHCHATHRGTVDKDRYHDRWLHHNIRSNTTRHHRHTHPPIHREPWP